MSKKGTNTLCVVSFLIVLLGIGLYCIFKLPPPTTEHIQTLPGSQIRTLTEDLTPHTNNAVKDQSLGDDNIELIDI